MTTRYPLPVLLCLVLVALTFAISARAADDEAGFVPLFNGNDLAGWRGDENFWRVEDGTVIAESTADNPCKENTFLIWDNGEVDNFELRLRFRISGSDSANSGIQFRGTEREDGHVVGYQADIDKAGQWVGALYDEATDRKMLAARGQKTVVADDGKRLTTEFATATDLFKHIKADDWNDYRILAVGDHITLSINGHVTAEVIDRQPGERDLIGKLALQLHSGPPMKIEFKNVRLKRLPMEDYKKVVFVAGSPSHGYMSHEHNAGCLLLAEKLNTAREQDGLPVVATVYNNGWPKDPTAFDNADTVVSYCDGGGRHYLNEYLDEFDKLMEADVGLVCIHYAVETVKGEPGDHFLKWIGGFFEPHWSVNPHWTANFDDLPEHEITRGVEPFEINDEWYYHMRFVPDMNGVTPILTDMPPRETLNREDGAHSGNPFVREAILQRKEPQHVAWAYERPSGGRGFGFTGGHFHKNWQHDQFRKTVLNAIVWTAGGEVPAEGVESATPTDAQIEANQDEPKPEEKAADAETLKKREGLTSADAALSHAKPAFRSDIVTPATPGRTVDIDVDITGAEGLWLVTTDAGDGFSCDWADWATPMLTSISEQKRVRVKDGKEVPYVVSVPQTMSFNLRWKSATTNFGEVRMNQNASGGAMSIDGKPVEWGIGTHANSVIHFELPEGHNYSRFTARGGLDDGGTGQTGCGDAASIRFAVFTSAPSAVLLKASMSAAPADGRASDAAIAGLDVHDDLQVSLFAAEPIMRNPTNIDIDHLGRVWICEVVNYRRFRNGDMQMRDEGDRILILEDTDGDGQADKDSTFYQGTDIDSAHGICVLPTVDGKGTRAIVSAKDQVFFLIDDDGDLKADRKEVLFTGISGTEHDHGIHAFVFGPDGKLYFNFGNAGQQIKDKNGETIVDVAGNVVNDTRNPYQQGMVFRCNMDGSQFETLGWNFRNNWEVCVDSLGTMWQSDNDDDGNRGTRINYIMEYGNYGYKDEFTGAAWQEPRTGWETDIPERHWHLNDPGVVPNLLQTGAGSPTGICLYEGDLLPELFRNQIIHCDAGPSIVRCYPVRPDGAGFTAESVTVLEGTRDNWFRPSDVCTAPDGSLLVADWYDPGVGGHRMQDVDRGRLFRLTPKGHDGAYAVPPQDFSTPVGAVQALQSPNLATRYVAWTTLQAMGAKAEDALMTLWRSDDERMRARALWALSKLDIKGDVKKILAREALKDPSENIRVLAYRVCRQQRDKFDVKDVYDVVDLQDPSPAVRREMLIAAREMDNDVVPTVWAELALQHDGEDRWYLEALGIGAGDRWNECLAQYLTVIKNDLSKPGAKDMVWRSRADQTPEQLAEIIRNPQVDRDELPRYFRAFDFQRSPNTQTVLEQLAVAETDDTERTSYVNAEAFARLDGFNVNDRPEMKTALDRVLDAQRGIPEFVALVKRFRVSDRDDELIALATSQPDSQIAVDALGSLLERQQLDPLREVLWSDNVEKSEALVRALTTAGNGRTSGLLHELVVDADLPIELRRHAVRALGQTQPGAKQLLAMAQSKQYDEALQHAVAGALHTAQAEIVRAEAAKLFPLPPGKDAEPLPPIDQLVAREGNVEHGRIVFHSTGTCQTCHTVNGLGREVGPDLSEIGKKLSKQAFFESILYPSAGISHNYEMWTVLTADGRVLDGLLVNETDDELQIKDAKAIVHTIKTDEIEAKKKQDVSLMPADLQKVMSAEELVDVVAYMATLQQKKP